VRSTDSRYCAGKAAHDHILAVDTHINFSMERTTGRSWRGRSPYLWYYRLQSVHYLIYSRSHLSGPRSVYALPLVYKRESALVRTQGSWRQVLKNSEGSQGPASSLGHTGLTSFLKQYNIQVDVGYYAPAAQTTLNPCAFSVFIHSLIKRS
jgi:hypothetical protein